MHEILQSQIVAATPGESAPRLPAVAAPLFIVGVPRSGTTLLAVLLDNHPDIFVAAKTRGLFFADLLNVALRSFGTRGDCRSQSLAERILREFQADHRTAALASFASVEGWAGRADIAKLLLECRHQEAQASGKSLWGDKCPFQVELLLPQLRALFPAARVVHVIRDGRAVAASQMKRQLTDPVVAIHNWKRLLLQARLQGDCCGQLNYLEVKYEALVREPERQLRRICDFLSVAYEPAMLQMHRHRDTQSALAYVAQDLDPARIDAWQQELRQRLVRRLERVAGDLLLDLGYPLRFAGQGDEFRALAPAERLWREQLTAARKLLRHRRTAMIDRQLVEQTDTFSKRVRRFLAESAGLWLSPRVVEIFVRRKRML